MWSLDAKTLFVFYWRWNQGLEDSLGQEGALLDMTTGMFSLVLTLIFLLSAYGSPRCPADPLCEPVITPRAGSEKGISPCLQGMRDSGIQAGHVWRPISQESSDSHALICAAFASVELRFIITEGCANCETGRWFWNHFIIKPPPTPPMILLYTQTKKKKKNNRMIVASQLLF